jgi:hypothetical protein
MSADVTCHRCQCRWQMPPTLTDEVVTCPACLTMLVNPHGSQKRGLEAEVRRDKGATWVILGLLALFAVIGITLMAGSSASFAWVVVLSLVCLLLVVFMAGLVRTRSVEGGLLLTVALMTLIPVGIVIVFATYCASHPFNPH